MLALAGTYQNGHLTLEQEFASEKPVKVIVTFLEDVVPQPRKRLHFSDFSFAKSQQILANVTGSFSDTVVEERASDR